jgi:hypothetical protein
MLDKWNTGLQRNSACSVDCIHRHETLTAFLMKSELLTLVDGV